MPKKPRKRRSIAVSRSASLKGWRTRKRMTQAQLFHAIDEIDRLYEQVMKGSTIDRIPKVEWK